jgi:hypothetical protein
MPLSLIIFCIAFAVCGLAALLAPHLAHRYPSCAPDIPASALRRYRWMTVYMAVVAVTFALDLSLPVFALNVLALFLAVAGAGAMVVFVVRMKPRRLLLPLGLIMGVALLMLTLDLLLDCLEAAISRVVVRLDNGQYCQENVYGFAGNDSGAVVQLFDRYGPVDHRVLRVAQSVTNPGTDPSLAPPLQKLVDQCQAKVNRARIAAYQAGQ